MSADDRRDARRWIEQLKDDTDRWREAWFVSAHDPLVDRPERFGLSEYVPYLEEIAAEAPMGKWSELLIGSDPEGRERLLTLQFFQRDGLEQLVQEGHAKSARALFLGLYRYDPSGVRVRLYLFDDGRVCAHHEDGGVPIIESVDALKQATRAIFE